MHALSDPVPVPIPLPPEKAIALSAITAARDELR